VSSSRPKTWDLKSAAEVSELIATPDGKTVVAGLPVDDDSVRVLDFPTGTRRNHFPKTDGRYITLSPDGHTLAFGFERDAYLWDLSTEDGNPRKIPGKESVRRMAFSNDGRFLALCGEDRLIRVFEVATLGEPLLKIAGHASEILGVGFSPDGRTLISGDRAGFIKLWQVSTGRHILDLARVGDSSFGRIEVSPRGRYIAYSHYRPDGSSIVVHDLQMLQSKTLVENGP
jgi:WD40 repeat protein